MGLPMWRPQLRTQQVVRKVFTVLLLGVFWTSNLWASSCSLPKNPAALLAHAEQVVLATVRHVTEVGAEYLAIEGEEEGLQVAVLSVRQSWKSGHCPEHLVVLNHRPATGIDFVANRDYLVYARRDFGELSVGPCSGSRELPTVSGSWVGRFRRAWDLRELGGPSCKPRSTSFLDSDEVFSSILQVWASETLGNEGRGRAVIEASTGDAVYSRYLQAARDRGQRRRGRFERWIATQ